MLRTALAAPLAFVLLAGPPLRAAEQPSLEQLTAGVDAAGRITDPMLRQRTGWEVLRGFRWRIELEDPNEPGQFRPADAGRTFRHGQRFRIRVEALCDLFVYVLNRNADGSEVVLLPEQAEQVPQVKRGRALTLPADGGAFRFTPPAGTEQLRLLVSPRELPWVASRELFKVQNGQQLSSQEQAALDQLKVVRTRSVNTALRQQQQLPQVRGLPAALQAIAKGRLERGCQVVVLDGSAQGQLVTHTSSDPKSEAILVHDILLKHGD
jgi:hypothetical protein